VLIAEPPLDARPYSINLADLPYPYPVQHFSFRFYGEEVRLAYMDVAPRDEPNGNTIVLLHGLNFFGEAWGPTIEVFRDRGFRVIVPDQIGFGRSSKPTHVRYTLNDMARNTRALLDRLGVDQAQVLGHSMGGMVATRFALLNPDLVTSLVLVNQIGLTDARLTAQPGGFDALYENSLARNWVDIRRNLERYFVEWKPEYEKYVLIHYGWTLSGAWPHMARVRAMLLQMVMEDPVVYDWPAIKARTLVIGGEVDGPDFPQLAKQVAATIPDAQLVLFANVGHNPFMEAPERFYPAVLAFLTGP